jgi:hypothetical protein
MKNKFGGLFLAAPLLAFALALPARAADPASTVCKDGTTSTATGRGACSGHGGVQKAVKTPAAASASDAATSASAAPGATTCKDGTTSPSSGRGACSGHGGVQKASKSKPAADAAEASTPGASTPGASTPGASSTAAPSTAAKSSVASKSAPTEKAGNTDPTGATAKCKDGTYSKSQHHTGTCSHHGGVAEWLKAQ